MFAAIGKRWTDLSELQQMVLSCLIAGAVAACTLLVCRYMIQSRAAEFPDRRGKVVGESYSYFGWDPTRGPRYSGPMWTKWPPPGGGASGGSGQVQLGQWNGVLVTVVEQEFFTQRVPVAGKVEAEQSHLKVTIRPVQTDATAAALTAGEWGTVLSRALALLDSSAIKTGAGRSLGYEVTDPANAVLSTTAAGPELTSSVLRRGPEWTALVWTYETAFTVLWLTPVVLVCSGLNLLYRRRSAAPAANVLENDEVCHICGYPLGPSADKLAVCSECGAPRLGERTPPGQRPPRSSGPQPPTSPGPV